MFHWKIRKVAECRPIVVNHKVCKSSDDQVLRKKLHKMLRREGTEHCDLLSHSFCNLSIGKLWPCNNNEHKGCTYSLNNCVKHTVCKPRSIYCYKFISTTGKIRHLIWHGMKSYHQNNADPRKETFFREEKWVGEVSVNLQTFLTLKLS